MKMKWCMMGFLMFSLCAGVTLNAQQPDANRKEFEANREKALAGDAKAQSAVGIAYFNGKGVVKTDLAEAIKWFRKAADQGDLDGQFMLGLCYENGYGVEKEYTNAFNWYRRVAESGFAGAQSEVGLMYFNGNGVPKDYAEAVKWFRKAADQGNAEAEYDLGVMYERGNGLEKDSAEAIKWFRKAAEQGNAVAQSDLGTCYDKGDGVTKDEMEAVKWFRKAAEQNAALAQYNLGTCYSFGNGVPQDYVEAVNLFRKAAEQSYAPAQYNLGVCYYEGNGVPKNYVEALKWYRKAAEQNDARAQFNLGICSYRGEGAPQNYIEAYQWLNLAAAQGNADAAKWRDVVSRYMTKGQIAEGQRLAAAFIPGKETMQNQGAISSNSIPPKNPTVTATGFFITDDGYLISNYHVVKEAVKVRLVTGAGIIDAMVVKVDAANDLALLKAVGRFASLPIAASRTVKLGGTVATVGFPNIGMQGFSPKLAKGEIASLSGSQDDPRYFQISVPVQPGNSGGALVNAHGNVVGIVAAKLDASVALAASGSLPENVNYAVKSSLLLSFLESVPDVDAKLKVPNTRDESFEDVVKSAQDAAVLVLVY
jgi:uncharacterized protein